MTMIRPKIRGLKKTAIPKDNKSREKGQKIGIKGKEKMEGEFLRNQGMVR